MSNPWAQSFDDLRSPYLQEKKAKKDYDGDGKIESGAKEYRGVVHNKIQKAKGGKADGQDTSSVKEEKHDDSKVSMRFGDKKQKERKEKLEKKRGMKLGKHPQFESKAMKSFLDKKAKMLEKKKKNQSAPYKNNPAFGDDSHHSNKKNRMEHHRRDEDGNTVPHEDELVLEKKGKDKKGKKSGKKDACYHKVKANSDVWPSAYASGRLVQCRKKGAKNWGKSKKESYEFQIPLKSFDQMVGECWKTHERVPGTVKGAKGSCRPKGSGRTKNEEIERIDEVDLKQVGDKINKVKTKIGNAYKNFMGGERGKEIDSYIKTRSRLSGSIFNSYEPEGEMIEAVKTPKLDIKETGVKNKIEINPEIKTEAAKAPVKKHSNSNHTERKPKKAMDAGARGRRLLQRREYAAKVSGSEDRVPKELEDSYKYMTSREYTMAEAMKCWNGYKKTGTQKMFGKTYNKCEKEEVEMEASNPAQQAAIAIAKKNRKQDLMVAKKTKKEEVQLEAKKSCGEGEYYCHDRKKCMPIPKGSKVGKDGMLVKEDMKGMSQKSGDKRSTKSGAGMTAKGVAKYNRRTGGNLKTAVTTPPSKLKAGSKAAKRRKSFCARSKSWTGPRGKAARRRWNCSYEPELPMIIDEKKLYNGAPLSDRVAAWARKINEGKLIRGNYGTYVDGQKKDTRKEPKINPKLGLPVVDRASYNPQGDVISELDFKNIKRNVKDTIDNFGSGLKVIGNAIRNPGTGLNPHTREALRLNKKLNQSYEPQGEMIERTMTSPEKKKKEDYVKGMKKDKKGFTKRYGKDAKSVMYATATKMAMKKEAVFNDPKLNRMYPIQPKLTSKGAVAFRNTADPNIFRGNKKIGGGMVAKNTDFTRGIDAIKNNKNKYSDLIQKMSYEPEGQMIEAKDDRSAGVSEDFYQKRYAGVGKGYKTVGKNKRMDKSNKRGGDSKKQYRDLHKEGDLHSWFKGSKSKDGKGGWVNVVTGGTCASDKPGEGTPKCVSSAKRASMTKAERLSAQRRKKKADPGQQSKSGAAKPTYVSTDKPKKKVDEMNQGPSSPITVGQPGVPNLGAGRIGKIKLKKPIGPLTGAPIPKV